MKALIVDDEEGITCLIAKYLSGMGFESIEVVHTLEEALGKAGEVKPDIITLDLNLGPECKYPVTLAGISDLQQASPNSVIIVITGVLSAKDAAMALDAGAHGFMEKAVSLTSKTNFLQSMGLMLRSLVKHPEAYKVPGQALEKFAALCATKRVALNESKSPNTRFS